MTKAVKKAQRSTKRARARRTTMVIFDGDRPVGLLVFKNGRHVATYDVTLAK